MHSGSVELVARLCHEVNRGYSEGLGDGSQPGWQDAPPWMKESAVKGVELLLRGLRRGRRPSPQAAHESWMEEKRRDGWKHGAVKDIGKKEHPGLVPWEELPQAERVKDYIFASMVAACFDAGVIE